MELPDDPATGTFSGGGGALRGQRKTVEKPASNRGRKKKGEKKRRKKENNVPNDDDDVIDNVDQRDKLSDDRTYFAMQALKNALPEIVVSGFPSINRAVVSESDGKYSLLVEGYGLGEVIGAPGVDGVNTTTNHVAEVESVLGIEAARATICSEVSYIMQAYGIAIDARHLLLLADVMTFKGMVLGITRFGVSKMRESVLMLASFERTTDHLFDAAVHGRTDAIVGVSECIIMGIPVPLGCGSFKLLLDSEYAEKAADDEKKERPLILGKRRSPAEVDDLKLWFATRRHSVRRRRRGIRNGRAEDETVRAIHSTASERDREIEARLSRAGEDGRKGSSLLVDAVVEVPVVTFIACPLRRRRLLVGVARALLLARRRLFLRLLLLRF